MRIDAHAHAMHAELGPDGRRVPPLMSPWQEAGVTPEEQLLRSGGVPFRKYPPALAPISAGEHIERYRVRGIEKLMLLDPPEITFEIQRIFGGFVLACPQIEMDKSSPADVAALLDRGAVGIKFNAPMHPYGSDCYLPLYRAVRERNALAVFHTGFLAHHFFDPGGVIPRPGWINMSHMRPAELDRINRAFPELKILMAHFGNPWWDEAHSLLQSASNIYADFSGGSAYRRSMAAWKDLLAPNGSFNPKVVSKLVYAADAWMFHAGHFEDDAQMAFYDRLYDALGLPQDIRALIDRENILRLVDPQCP